MVESDSQNIQTGGGAYNKGDVATGGGDFVSRDKIVQNIQLDIPKLLAALRESLPSGDPAPQHLLEVLKKFQFFHTRLHEWKKLHGCMNNILNDQGQFIQEVDRLEMTGKTPDASVLKRLWRPVGQKAAILLDWSATVQFIAAPPFRLMSEGVQGPPWAVEIYMARKRLEELLDVAPVNVNELSDAAYDFVDVVERYMYQADESLRDTADELYDLSQVVLGGLAHE